MGPVLCVMCGRLTESYALLGELPYCHGTTRPPTCYQTERALRLFLPDHQAPAAAPDSW